jgi:uncharacterized membrane protein
MNRFWRGLDGDLRFVAALALAGVLVTVLPIPDPLRAIVFIPLVLAVPGYAITAALFPPSFVTREERAVLSIALSVAFWALAGLVLQLMIDLDRWVWLTLAVIVTLGAVLLAQSRRMEQPSPAPRRRPPRPRVAAVAAAALTAAITVVALAVASGGQQRELDRAHFTSVWIAPPAAGGEPLSGEISVGVRNQEGAPAEYTVVVTTQGRTIEEWDLSLEDDETWLGAVPAAEAEAAVVASLLSDGILYRRVKLEYGALK